jgi:outer membrane cobalamin receptor
MLTIIIDNATTRPRVANEHGEQPPRKNRMRCAPAKFAFCLGVATLLVRQRASADDQEAAAAVASSAASVVLRGAVHDQTNAPVDGAIVEALGATDTPIAQARSDARGRFAMPPLPPGAYRVRVRHADFATATTPVELGPTSPPLDVALEARVVEVHVSGDRTAASGQTGSSVALLSRKELQSLPGGDAQTLTQVFLTQPGFTPDSFGPDGVLHIRGTEMGVLYVVDGVPLPGGLAGQFADVLPTGMVQRLRMFTGGQPVEYGPNAGGVVDVATRRGTGTPEGEVQMVYGTYQRAQPSAWYSQALGKADVFVAGSFLSTQRGLDPPAATPILHDAMQSGNVFARVDYRPNDSDRIELVARYSEHHFQIPIDPTLLPLSEGPPGAMRGPDTYGNAPPPFVPYNANPAEIERDLFVAVSYSHVFSGGSVQLSPYVRSSYGDLSCDPAGSLGATADPGSICSNVTRRLLHEGQTAAYAWTVGGDQRWKVGVSFDDAQSSIDYTQFTRDDASPTGGEDPSLTVAGHDNTNIFLGGAFVQDEITVGDLKLFPGLRVDVQSSTFAGTSEPNLVLVGPSARFGFSYALARGILLHGSVGYLWQPPNAVDAAVAARVLVPSLAGQPLAIDLKAERDEAGEIGLSCRASRQVEATLTGYGRYSQDQLDVLTVGSTNLIEDYNYAKGRAVGAEMTVHATGNEYLRGFGNASWNIGQGQGVDSVRYLFSPAQLAYPGWQILDHVQAWTVNIGADLHDESEKSHLSVLYQYGSGLRTGADNNETVPAHSTWNMTLRHRFDFPLRLEVAVDVLNVLDASYAIRIANGFVGSAYGPLRQVDLRLMVPFGG